MRSAAYDKLLDSAASTRVDLIADYLEYAIKNMRKRVWVPGDDDRYWEMKDGAVPVWLLKQEIERLRGRANALRTS